MKKKQDNPFGIAALRPANPIRGANWREQACEFYDEVQPPCILPDKKVDPIFSRFDPEYDAKSAGPHSRASWARRMRLAGAHEQMHRSGRAGFSMYRYGRGQWKVDLAETFIKEGLIVEALDQTIDSLRRQLLYLYQGVNLKALPDRDKREIEQHVKYTLHMLQGSQMSAQIAQSAMNDLESALKAAMRQLALGEAGEE